MSTDEAREYLQNITDPEWHRYIRNPLAGDFSVMIAEKMRSMEAENKRLKQDIKDWNDDCLV